MPRVPQRAGVSTTHDDRTPSALGSGSGTCVRGFARQGSGVLAGGSPTFGFSQGRQVTLEPPAPVPRAGRQVPGGREPRAGGPAPDCQSPGDRREPTTSARPETLAAGGGQFCPPGLRQGHPAGCVEASGLPIQCSAWHHPDCGPSRRPSRAPCPRLPYPAADGSFSLNLFSCET